MQYLLGVSLAIAMAACAAQGATTTAAITFDACTPPQIVGDADATATQVAAIAEAQALWRSRGAPLLGVTAQGTAALHFASAAPFDHGLYDNTTGTIYINRDLADVDTIAIVIAHELGHAFGLVHVGADTRRSVMNPGNLVVQPTADDQLALEAVSGVCGGGT